MNIHLTMLSSSTGFAGPPSPLEKAILDRSLDVNSGTDVCTYFIPDIGRGASPTPQEKANK